MSLNEISDLCMAIVKNELLERRGLYLELLKNKKYKQIISNMNKLCFPYCLAQSPGDYTKLTPYKKGNLISEYLNYSEISHGDLKYIAASKPKNIRAFQELMKKSDVVISCIKDINYVTTLTKSTPFCLNDKIIFYDEIYKEGRVLRFENWIDHDVLESQDFELFYDYYKSCGFKRPLVHCLAGVGRTGFFIMYDILSSKNVDYEVFINVLVDLRLQRNGLVYSEKQLKFLAEKFISS